MPKLEVKDIRKALEKQLEPKRYEHTIGVAYTAFSLALRYGADSEKALIAGLLHDCAKCLDSKERNLLCKKYNIELTSYEIENTSLVHAKLGRYLAYYKYGIEDKEILDSILYHTTGKMQMTLLEKIIFAADYVEPNRKKILGLEEIRSIIFEDLDKAVYLILKN